MRRPSATAPTTAITAITALAALSLAAPALAAPAPPAPAAPAGPALAPAAQTPPSAAQTPPPAPPAPPAAAPAPRLPRLPRILVLPLPPSHAVDASIARAFDARLLVALDDTRRVTTTTPSDEPECTSMSCLAELGAADGAELVLAMTVVREADGLTLFGTLVDTKTAAAARRIELARIAPANLARVAPAELVPQIVAAGAAAPPARRGPAVLGMTPPAGGAARAALLAVGDRLSAYRTFRVLPLDTADRSPLTHRAELVISELDVVDRRRGLCTWHDGTLVGTLSIVDLATGRAVFTRTVRLADSQRALTSSREHVLDALLEAAVADWTAAFHASGLEPRLRRAPGG